MGLQWRRRTCGGAEAGLWCRGEEVSGSPSLLCGLMAAPMAEEGEAGEKHYEIDLQIVINLLLH